MLNGIGLYLDSAFTQPVSEVGGKFAITTQVYDFGKVLQLWIRNEWDRNLKKEYIFITGDKTESLFGERYCSISNYDGTNETITGKLYLKNQDLPPNNSEMFQIKISPKYGITNSNDVLLTIAITNNEVNVPVYQTL